MTSHDTLGLGARRRTAWQVVRESAPYLWPEQRFELRVRVVLAILCLLVGRSANVYGPIVLREIIDGLEALVLPGNADAAVRLPGVVSLPGEVWALIGLAGVYGAAVLLPGVLTELRNVLFVPVSEHAQRTLALRTFGHVHELSLRFHLERRTGGLSRVIERGGRALQQLTGLFAFNIAPTVFEITAVSLYLAAFYPSRYVGVILIAVVVYLTFTLLYTEWRTKFRRMMVAEESRATTIGVDSLLNFETVKYFGNEPYERARYNDALLGYQRAAIKSENTLALLNAGQVSIRVACQIAILVLAILDHAGGRLSTGEVVMLNTYMLQLFIPLGFLGSSYRLIRQALVDMELTYQILDIRPEIEDRPGARDLIVTEGRVEFERVHFRYEHKRPILHDVTFTIPPGQTTAVVGPSGAGKSTLARLLYRFYDVEQGAVRIDGQNVADVTQRSLRRAVGIVPQDTVLFNDTIRYNIRYGRADATDAEIAHAARLAAIHDFISSLPDGYDTRVGERGLKLSGGEKQRVAIARTILKNPPVLVLDEATSALDTRTEREIQAALRQVARGRTTLIIAHRLATIVHADEILVIDHGRIVERGTHAALVAAGGVYAEMWQRQKEAADELEKLRATLGSEAVETVLKSDDRDI
jgi:ATP-binding cassette, subfamily B, heavy metal transporter